MGSEKTISKSEKRHLFLAETPVVSPQREQEDKGVTEWIPFFYDSDNIYINDLAKRIRQGPAHSSIINAKHTYAVGKSLLAKNDASLKNQGNFNTIPYLYSNAQRDWISFGNLCIEVDPVAKVLFHHDATTVRVSRDKKEALISENWVNIQNNRHWNKKLYPITKRLPLTPKNNRNYMVRLTTYTPEYGIYGLPDYIAALRYAEIEHRIGSFNLGRFERGFMPSAIITMHGSPPEGMSEQKYADKFLSKFTGEDNDHKIAIQFSEDPETDPDYIEMNEPREGDFIDLDELTIANLITAHSWFPKLSGIVVPGSLGDSKDLDTEYEQAINAVVIPRYQNPVLRFLEGLLALIGITENLSVEQVLPVSVRTKIDPEKVLTIDEQRRFLGEDPLPNGEGNRLLNGTDNNRGSNTGDPAGQVVR